MLNVTSSHMCCSVLQCVAVCCSVLQCAAVCCSVIWLVITCAAAWCSTLQCVAVCCAVCCRVLQSAAVCCVALQCAASRRYVTPIPDFPPKSPMISGSFAERDLQLKASCDSITHLRHSDNVTWKYLNKKKGESLTGANTTGVVKAVMQ